MGLVDKTHQALFDAIHRDHMPISDMQSLANFYSAFGVSAASFLSTANSFVVDGQIAHGDQLVREYGVSATPTLIVNGKYRVEMNSEKHIGPAEAIDIVLQLVKQESTAHK
jgi:thiol:disulfide interchange protein DsbA